MIFFKRIFLLILLYSIAIPNLIATENSQASEIKGEIGEWQEANSLLESVTGHYSFSLNDTVYIFSGQTLSMSRAVIFSSEFSNGKTKFWKKNPLSYVFEDFGATLKDNILYIIGGKTMGLERGSVNFFTIDSSIKSTMGTRIPDNLLKVCVTVNKNYIFVSGGKKGNKVTDRVFSSALNFEGMPGNWQEVTPLPIELYNHIMFSYKDFIYISGGYHNGGSVYGAKVNSDGTISKWIGMDDTPVSLERHAFTIDKDNIYISGGICDGKPQTGVYVGKFLEDGMIIHWKKLKNLSQPLFDHSMTTNKNFLIVSGGISGGRSQTKILIAPIKQ